MKPRAIVVVSILLASFVGAAWQLNGSLWQTPTPEEDAISSVSPTPTATDSPTPNATPAPSPTPEAQDKIGEDDSPWNAISAIGTAALGGAAVVGGAFGFRQYTQQRRRQRAIDTLRNQADLVNLLRDRLKPARGANREEVQSRLNSEQTLLEALLRQVIHSEPELLKLAEQRRDTLFSNADE